MSKDDNTTVGLSERTHLILQKLTKDEKVFNEMRDGYRFGIALAISKGTLAPDDTKFDTIFNVGSLDPDGAIRDIICQLYPAHCARPYALAERLAESGVAELGDIFDNDQLRFGEIFAAVSPDRA